MSKGIINRHLRYLYICLPFTLVLFLYEAGLRWAWLSHPWVQLAICVPVFATGMYFFGVSAWKSILKGRPNMNVLIAVGALAAFAYSFAGTVLALGPGYIFYETSAAVITIVLFGYYLEDISVARTQRALDGLVRSEKVMANMVAYDEARQEMVFPVESDALRSGDLILVSSGERVPADAKVLWGEGSADESVLTGESLPVGKRSKDLLIGGSVLVSGVVRAQVSADAGSSVMDGIVRMMRDAQREKPPIRRLADKISSVFVPVVLGLAVVTCLLNWLVLGNAGTAMLRAVAVLVIACPCAMGLATPTAMAVGLGRAARMGILFRRAAGLEAFKHIRRIAFDKTGTLTTGEFGVIGSGGLTVPAAEFERVVYSLEQHSQHPIARSIVREWKQKGGIRWRKIEEIRGVGMRGVTMEGKVYMAGSHKVLGSVEAAPGGMGEAREEGRNGTGLEEGHSVYVTCDGVFIGWIDVEDRVRPEALAVVQALKEAGYRVAMVSGDRAQRCARVAAELGIDEVYAQRSPEQKLVVVARLNEEMPTALVGDGINDAPALAKAAVGIAMSDAAQLAVQTADVVIVGGGLGRLPAALALGRMTYSTIRANLFWALFYNILAIPVAALGLLTPAFAALVMGFSDVVLALNSLRLYRSKASVAEGQ